MMVTQLIIGRLFLKRYIYMLYMLYSSLSVLYEVAMYVVNVYYDTSIAKRIYGCVYH